MLPSTPLAPSGSLEGWPLPRPHLGSLDLVGRGLVALTSPSVVSPVARKKLLHAKADP